MSFDYRRGDYKYVAREPLRIGLSLKNVLISKLLVAPVVWGDFTLRAMGGVSFDLSYVFRPKPTLLDSSIDVRKEAKLKQAQFEDPRTPSKRKPISIYLADPSKAYKLGAKPYVTLDFIPRELNYRPEGSFNSIGVVGVNNPHYHYGGGEDTLTFDIDWYGVGDKESVITKCRKVEALTMADGHNAPPRTIYINWDDGEMFKNHYFIVTSAPYRMEHFLQNRWETYITLGPDGVDARLKPTSVPHHLMPIRAIQSVTLKRVTDHSLRWGEMV